MYRLQIDSSSRLRFRRCASSGSAAARGMNGRCGDIFRHLVSEGDYDAQADNFRCLVKSDRAKP
jgi:hypothetical protein